MGLPSSELIWFDGRTSFLFLRRHLDVLASQCWGSPESFRSGQLLVRGHFCSLSKSAGVFLCLSPLSWVWRRFPETFELGQEERSIHLLAGPVQALGIATVRCRHVIYRPRQKGENEKRGGKRSSPLGSGGSLASHEQSPWVSSHAHFFLPGLLLVNPSLV